MNAKSIGYTVWAAMLFAVSPGIAGESAGKYREDLMTLDGKRYDEVRLVKVDPNGLLFRHRDGIAKVTFDNLGEGFRDYYGYDEALARDFERKHSVAKKVAPVPKEIGDIEEDPEIVITYRTRTSIPIRFQNPYACAQSACRGVPWYSHWARYDPRLAYASLPCRQLAERDFWIRSGIVPTRPGMLVRSLRW